MSCISLNSETFDINTDCKTVYYPTVGHHQAGLSHIIQSDMLDISYTTDMSDISYTTDMSDISHTTDRHILVHY